MAKRFCRLALATGVVVAAIGLAATPASAAYARARSFTTTATPSAPVVGQAIKVSASLTPEGGGAPRGGTITFLVDDVEVATKVATTRITSTSVSGLRPGYHSFFTRYSGDDRTWPGASNRVLIYVEQISTAATITGPASVPQTTRPEIRVQVRNTGTGTNRPRPTGRVQFQLDGVRFAEVPLNANGIAVWRPQLRPGRNVLRAFYSGDDLHFAAATTKDLVVRAAPTGTEVDIDNLVSATSTIDVTGTPGPQAFVAQTFVASRTGRLTSVELVGDPSAVTGLAGDLAVSILAIDESGEPSSNILGGGWIRTADTPDGGPATVAADLLEGGAPVTAGTTYAVFLQVIPENPDQGSTWSVGLAADSSYAGGSALVLDDTHQWSELAADLVFRTSIVPDAA